MQCLQVSPTTKQWLSLLAPAKISARVALLENEQDVVEVWTNCPDLTVNGNFLPAWHAVEMVKTRKHPASIQYELSLAPLQAVTFEATLRVRRASGAIDWRGDLGANMEFCAADISELGIDVRHLFALFEACLTLEKARPVARNRKIGAFCQSILCCLAQAGGLGNQAGIDLLKFLRKMEWLFDPHNAKRVLMWFLGSVGVVESLIRSIGAYSMSPRVHSARQEALDALSHSPMRVSVGSTEFSLPGRWMDSQAAADAPCRHHPLIACLVLACRQLPGSAEENAVHRMSGRRNTASKEPIAVLLDMLCGIIDSTAPSEIPPSFINTVVERLRFSQNRAERSVCCRLLRVMATKDGNRIFSPLPSDALPVSTVAFPCRFTPTWLLQRLSMETLVLSAISGSILSHLEHVIECSRVRSVGGSDPASVDSVEASLVEDGCVDASQAEGLLECIRDIVAFKKRQSKSFGRRVVSQLSLRRKRWLSPTARGQAQSGRRLTGETGGDISRSMSAVDLPTAAAPPPLAGGGAKAPRIGLCLEEEEGEEEEEGAVSRPATVRGRSGSVAVESSLPVPASSTPPLNTQEAPQPLQRPESGADVLTGVRARSPDGIWSDLARLLCRGLLKFSPVVLGSEYHDLSRTLLAILKQHPELSLVVMKKLLRSWPMDSSASTSLLKLAGELVQTFPGVLPSGTDQKNGWMFATFGKICATTVGSRNVSEATGALRLLDPKRHLLERLSGSPEVLHRLKTALKANATHWKPAVREGSAKLQSAVAARLLAHRPSPPPSPAPSLDSE